MANWILLLELMRLAAASMETVTRALERLSVTQSPVMRMQGWRMSMWSKAKCAQCSTPLARRIFINPAVKHTSFYCTSLSALKSFDRDSRLGSQAESKLILRVKLSYCKNSKKYVWQHIIRWSFCSRAWIGFFKSQICVCLAISLQNFPNRSSATALAGISCSTTVVRIFGREYLWRACTCSVSSCAWQFICT